MVVTMDKIFHRYGSRILLKRGASETEFRGFLQHYDSKSWQNMDHAYGPLGEIPRGKHVLLAPAELSVVEGDTLIMGSLEVVVRRVEAVMAGDRVMYLWGLCAGNGSDGR